MGKKIRNVLLGSLGIIILLACMVLIKDYAKYKEKNKDDSTVNNLTKENLPELLQEFSEKTNRKCPMVVDKNTRLDNTIVLSNKTVQYNYTFINLEKKDFNFKGIESHFKPNILNNVKTNPGLKFFRDNKVTLSYSYKDKNGNFIFKYKVSPDLYNN